MFAVHITNNTHNGTNEKKKFYIQCLIHASKPGETVCVCVCVCVCVSACVYVYVYMYVCVCVLCVSACVYVYVYMYVCVCVLCVYVYRCMCVLISIPIFIPNLNTGEWISGSVCQCLADFLVQQQTNKVVSIINHFTNM